MIPYIVNEFWYPMYKTEDGWWSRGWRKTVYYSDRTKTIEYFWDTSWKVNQ